MATRKSPVNLPSAPLLDWQFGTLPKFSQSPGKIYPKQDTCDLARCESCTSQDQMLDSSPLRFWDQLLLYQIFSPKCISHGLAFRRSKQRRHAALLAARVKALQRASAD